MEIIGNIRKKIILGTSDPWLIQQLSHCPIDQATQRIKLKIVDF